MKPLRIFLARVGNRDRAQHHMSPPLGIMYLASYIRDRLDCEVRLCDQRLEKWSNAEMVKEIADFEADVVGFTYATPSAYLVGDLSTKIRDVLPNALILIGGPHASGLREQALEDSGADAAVAGEGERSLEQILEAHLNGEDFSSIPGLIWRDKDGQILTNPGDVPFIEDLDSMPMPAYDLLDLPRYWEHFSFVLVPRRRYITLMTSRGCPYQCNYCHKVFGRRFRGHSPERIVDELDHFTKTYGISDVDFVDDIFNYDHDRAIEVCDLIHKRNLKIEFAMPNGVRTDTLSEELIDAMVSAGLYYSAFALETASPRIQKAIGKRLDIDVFLENVELAVKKGVFANGFAMLGFPTETEEELQATIDMMCNSPLHAGAFHTVTPWPGSPLYQIACESHPETMAKLDYSDTTTETIYVNLSAVPDDVLFAAQRKALRRFYMNPGRAFRILRDHPKPFSLPRYLPLYLMRTMKGVFS